MKNAIIWNLEVWPYYPSSKIDDFRRFHFFQKKVERRCQEVTTDEKQSFGTALEQPLRGEISN